MVKASPRKAPSASSGAHRQFCPFHLLLEGVSKSYGAKLAVDGVDLRLDGGGVVVLLGPNGAGKSTLIGMLAGLVKPDAGSVSLVTSPSDSGRSVSLGEPLGFMSQDPALYPSLSVHHNLVGAGELAGLRGSRLKTREEYVVDRLGLRSLLHRGARSLSGGEARRTHMAMALIADSPILLLDEPTAGVDSFVRSEILDLVNELADEGRAVLYTTHYMSEVAELDADVMVIEEGRLESRGSTNDFVSSISSSRVTLEFEGIAPVGPWPASWEVHGSTLTADLGSDYTTALPELLSCAELRSSGRIISISLDPSRLDQAFGETIAPVAGASVRSGRTARRS